nr:zinc-ribbon domain-containing protein [Butyrivibrio sp.]
MAFCGKCGSTNDDGAKFCKSCGAPLGAPANTAAPKMTPPINN